MKLKTVTKEELELMQFDDIAYLILKEKGDKMKINDIFREICDLLELGDKVFEDQIGDFFALIATEKRFMQLENGFWDLRENHTSEIKLKDMDEDLYEEELGEESEYEAEKEDTSINYDELDDEDDDEDDDDLKDLVIMDDEDMEENSSL